SATRLLQASRIALQNANNGNQRNDAGPPPREASRLRPPATRPRSVVPPKSIDSQPGQGEVRAASSATKSLLKAPQPRQRSQTTSVPPRTGEPIAAEPQKQPSRFSTMPKIALFRPKEKKPSHAAVSAKVSDGQGPACGPAYNFPRTKDANKRGNCQAVDSRVPGPAPVPVEVSNGSLPRQDAAAFRAPSEMRSRIDTTTARVDAGGKQTRIASISRTRTQAVWGANLEVHYDQPPKTQFAANGEIRKAVTRPVLAVKALKPSDLQPPEKESSSTHASGREKAIAPLAKPEKTPIQSPTVEIVSPLIKTN
ncbi:hypothetical protein AAVH_42465, partial [Aphelenchoides avenae]